jgi:hypothetical protein
MTTHAHPQDSAEEAVRRAEEEAQRAEAEARRAFDGLRRHARDAARDSGRIARDEANARVSGAFDSAAGEAERAARAAEDAAGEYDPHAMPARALESVSVLLEDTARGLRDTDLERVVDELRGTARRHPVTFLAGAAALGFAAARLARATDGDDGPGRSTRHAGDDARGYAGASPAAAPTPQAAAGSARAPDAPATPGTSAGEATDPPGEAAQAQGTGTAAGLRVENGRG